MTVINGKISKPITAVVRLYVEIEPKHYPYNFTSWDHEKQAEWLESWAEEMREFFRDHRSRDAARLSVERVTEMQCSACRREWETSTEDGKTTCAGCGTEVQP